MFPFQTTDLELNEDLLSIKDILEVGLMNIFSFVVKLIYFALTFKITFIILLFVSVRDF